MKMLYPMFIRTARSKFSLAPRRKLFELWAKRLLFAGLSLSLSHTTKCWFCQITAHTNVLCSVPLDAYSEIYSKLSKLSAYRASSASKIMNNFVFKP